MANPMTDDLPDTPFVAQMWCPGCAPKRDETKEVLVVEWCPRHKPSAAGLEDDLAKHELGAFEGFTGETDGASQRAWGKLLRERR